MTTATIIKTTSSSIKMPAQSPTAMFVWSIVVVTTAVCSLLVDVTGSPVKEQDHMYFIY